MAIWSSCSGHGTMDGMQTLALSPGISRRCSGLVRMVVLGMRTQHHALTPPKRGVSSCKAIVDSKRILCVLRSTLARRGIAINCVIRKNGRVVAATALVTLTSNCVFLSCSFLLITFPLSPSQLGTAFLGQDVVRELCARIWRSFSMDFDLILACSDSSFWPTFLSLSFFVSSNRSNKAILEQTVV